MHNFFTNAKNVFKACLNESNESINTYKSWGKSLQKFNVFLLPSKNWLTTICDSYLDLGICWTFLTQGWHLAIVHVENYWLNCEEFG